MKLKVIAAKYEPNKMHLYDVKTTGKHPVHLIEGGDLLTEDDRDFDQSSDMGWFWLNQKEYDYYRLKCEVYDVDVSLNMQDVHRLKQILSELYYNLDEEDVKKYYEPTINRCIDLLKTNDHGE